MKQKRTSKAAETSLTQDQDEQGTRIDEDGQEENATNLVALHRARMFDWSPTAVTALATTSDGTVLAAARDSGNLELWNTDHWTVTAVRSLFPAPELVEGTRACHRLEGASMTITDNLFKLLLTISLANTLQNLQWD